MENQPTGGTCSLPVGLTRKVGHKNYIFSTYDSHSQLHEAIRVVKDTVKQNWDIF